MNTKFGTCRLCEQQHELCLSHAVPKSAFRPALREGSGKAIALIDDETTPIQFSSDTWDVYLLCKDCEDTLNRKYDTYGIDVLKGGVGDVRRSRYGVTFTGLDRQRLRMFCLSVLWRVSVSHHDHYSNICLPHSLTRELHHALKQGLKVRNSIFTVAIYRLTDSNPEGFSYESLRSLVMAPIMRRFRNGCISICYVFFGFLVEIFLSKLPVKFMKKPGILTGASPIFMAPFQEILEVPELINLMASGLHKHENGQSRV